MSLPCSSTSSASRQANDLPLSRMPLSVGDLFCLLFGVLYSRCKPCFASPICNRLLESV
jgi:hypothetical protein